MGNTDAANFIVFGGVRVKSSEIAKKTVLKDEKGEDRYIIIFKSGVEASYKKGNGNGFITSFEEKLPTGISYDGDPQKRALSTNTLVDHTEGLELKGTKKLDFIDVANSKIIGIDTRDRGYDDVSVRNSKGDLGQSILKHKIGFGDIYADKNDAIKIQKCENVGRRDL